MLRGRLHGLQRNQAEAALLFLGLLGLGIGVAVYLLDRGGGAYFVPGGIGSALPVRSVFGSLNGSLPAFAHVFAFALLTAAILGPGRVGAGRICVAWWSLDTSFELAQADAARGYFLDLIPGALSDIGPVGQVASYFRHGTFDLTDVFATFVGACAAFLVISATRRQEETA